MYSALPPSLPPTPTLPPRRIDEQVQINYQTKAVLFCEINFWPLGFDSVHPIHQSLKHSYISLNYNKLHEMAGECFNNWPHITNQNVLFLWCNTRLINSKYYSSNIYILIPPKVLLRIYIFSDSAGGGSANIMVSNEFITDALTDL